MGWCLDFGVHVDPACDHPMVPGEGRCTCEACGASCPGRFEGCQDVWAVGPRHIDLVDRVVTRHVAPTVAVQSGLKRQVALRSVVNRVAELEVDADAGNGAGLQSEIEALRAELAAMRAMVERLPEQINRAVANAFEMQATAMTSRLEQLIGLEPPPQ